MDRIKLIATIQRYTHILPYNQNTRGRLIDQTLKRSIKSLSSDLLTVRLFSKAVSYCQLEGQNRSCTVYSPHCPFYSIHNVLHYMHHLWTACWPHRLPKFEHRIIHESAVVRFFGCYVGKSVTFITIELSPEGISFLIAKREREWIWIGSPGSDVDESASISGIDTSNSKRSCNTEV